jgi:hypothetical protein
VARVQVFVFVAKTELANRAFLGVATPSAVRVALGRAFPWFEVALAAAASDAVPPVMLQAGLMEGDPVLPDGSDSEKSDLTSFVRKFIEELQNRPDPALSPAQWIEFHDSMGQQVSERTQWLDARGLRDLLQTDLTLAQVRTPRGGVGLDVQRQILASVGTYVALLDPAGQFQSLVNRDDAIWEVLARVIEVDRATPSA